MKLSAVFPILLSAACIGCAPREDNRVPYLPVQIIVSKQVFANQRFLPTNTGDLAFDTQSGSLCKTWAWFDGYDAQGKHTISGQTPTCERLRDRYQTAAEVARSTQ